MRGKRKTQKEHTKWSCFNLVSCSCSPFLQTLLVKVRIYKAWLYSTLQPLPPTATAIYYYKSLLPYSNMQLLLYATVICRTSQRTRHGKAQQQELPLLLKHDDKRSWVIIYHLCHLISASFCVMAGLLGDCVPMPSLSFTGRGISRLD